MVLTSTVFVIMYEPQVFAPLAQLDRASGYEPEGREFESLRARHFTRFSESSRSKARSCATHVRLPELLGLRLMQFPLMADSSKTPAESPSKVEKQISMKELLEGCPPNEFREVRDFAVDTKRHDGTAWIYHVNTPDVQLHCPGDACGGLRFFRCANSDIRATDLNYIFLHYKCSNCQQGVKTFCVGGVRKSQTDKAATVLKIGETPPFGAPTPAKLITLIGPDRDLFLKGRRCENQGLGVGAFAYYRRGCGEPEEQGCL